MQALLERFRGLRELTQCSIADQMVARWERMGDGCEIDGADDFTRLFVCPTPDLCSFTD